MSFNQGEQAAIIELMSGKYAQLLAIETEWGIRLNEGDMRPRVEHFHDAVRALTSGSADIYANKSRLSVEHLAYDLSQLRQIQDKPIGKINQATEKSASTQVARRGERSAGFAKTPPQSVRAQIASLYKDYTVFFAALFAEVADHNYNARVNVIDSSVEDLALLEQLIQQLITGKITNAQAMEEVMHAERDDLRERLQAMLARKQMTAKEKQEALAMLGLIDKGLEKEKKALQQSHLHYATGQLAVYEDAKDTVKKLAAQGLNLAGKFVNTAIQAAGPGKGQGRS